jgi:hypothetical protein
MRPADATSETPLTTGGNTATVSFTMISLERARSRGHLFGLADAKILIEGISPTVQGIRVIYEPDGSLLVQPPRFRHPDGHWLEAVVLPPELAVAIAAEVLQRFRDSPI